MQIFFLVIALFNALKVVDIVEGGKGSKDNFEIFEVATSIITAFMSINIIATYYFNNIILTVMCLTLSVFAIIMNAICAFKYFTRKEEG